MSQELWGFNEPFPWDDELVPELAPISLEIPTGIEDVPEIPPRLPVPSGRFRLHASSVFLTYSQSALTRETITQWWARQRRVKRLIIGQEHHQDGHIHWHVCIEYDHRKDLRDPRHFDIDGEHPNIKTWTREGGSTFEQWLYNHWKYCRKEDSTPYVVGEEPSSGRKRKRDEVFTEAFKVARTEGVNPGMTFLETYAPYDLCTKYEAIQRALVKIRNISTQHQSDARAAGEFPNAPEVIGDWHCLFINGDTGFGKTQWARSLLPLATVVSHRDQLRDCDFSKGVIFDDFEVSHWPPTAVIHLLDWDEPRGLDVKHGHVIIPAHTKKIFTYNGSLYRWLSKDASMEQQAACERRVYVVNITSKLF